MDTSLDSCSVALARGDEVLASATETMQRGQAERLAPMVKDVLATAGVRFSELDRVTVTTGPGSFTGVRVGLSFARALAMALNKPCIGVSTLEVLALRAGERGLRAAAIAAPGASYVALYEDGAALIAPRACLADEREALVAAQVGARAVAWTGPGVGADIVALARRAAGVDPALYPPNPTYLRAPHVTLPADAA
ncbi:MAG: tRNA (adenosine(37)-N6)-threonylcarbamoyltransferase complex dimerization subunit type 1 TsaB [Hyphomonadaceae bacterium]|nr:tRNA (adenosine(37)-N6)-threonylcarbamoyltransferase complex dimerization subunit type 1 TsaB [Hyphomonadaceae bacterium]